MPANPCIAVCRLDPATGVCIGCGRRIDEIASWPDLDDTARARILARCRATTPDAAMPGARRAVAVRR
jgi:predicted Fe-S protein YdhL (DUF1289 family)